jgi:general secretion pathway protein N
MEANIGFDGWTLAFLDLRFPAALVGTFSRTFAALGLQGDVHAHLEGVSGDRQQVRGHGEILWREAASNLTRVRPLGDYRIALDGQGDRLDIVLATASGALRLSGSGTWRPAAGAAFRGEAVPSAETARELAPLLRLLGRDTGSGAYTLVLDDSTGLSVR